MSPSCKWAIVGDGFRFSVWYCVRTLKYIFNYFHITITITIALNLSGAMKSDSTSESRNNSTPEYYLACVNFSDHGLILRGIKRVYCVYWIGIVLDQIQN